MACLLYAIHIDWYSVLTCTCGVWCVVDTHLQAYLDETSQDLSSILGDLSETFLQMLTGRFSEV
jgi:hypothetical protein